MAPRTLQMITCFNIAVHVPLPAGKEAIALGSPKKKQQPAEETIALGSAKKRPWTREIKRKILASVRRERPIMPVRKEEPCDVDVEKQSTTPAQSARPALKKGILKGTRDDGSPEAIVAVAVDGVRKKKGLRVRFDLPQEEEIAAVAPVKPPPFPKGELGEPPESFRHTGPEMTAAFLASVVAGDTGSATPSDHDELVARRKERMEACSRRLSYLRDYCPFQREEDEESRPATTTTAEPDHQEEALPRVKIGLPFDCSESEAEFVKAIRWSYLLKDDFVSRQDCLMGAGKGAQRFVQELKAA